MLNQTRMFPTLSARLAILMLSTLFLTGCPTFAQPLNGGKGQPTSDEPESLQTQAPRMDNRRLAKLLQKHFPDQTIEGQSGLWQIKLPDYEPLAQEPAAKEPSADDQQEESNDQPGNENIKVPENEPETAPIEAGPGAGERLQPTLLVMTDQRADRMRIMIPIRPFNPQRVEDLQLALIALHANYDRALDARYAVKDGVLWSVFIHPLGSLTPADLSNGINQVLTLRANTGTSYSSSQFIFGPQDGQQDKAPAEEKKGPTEPKAPDGTIT